MHNFLLFSNSNSNSNCLHIHLQLRQIFNVDFVVFVKFEERIGSFQIAPPDVRRIYCQVHDTSVRIESHNDVRSSIRVVYRTVSKDTMFVLQVVAAFQISVRSQSRRRVQVSVASTIIHKSAHKVHIHIRLVANAAWLLECFDFVECAWGNGPNVKTQTDLTSQHTLLE